MDQRERFHLFLIEDHEPDVLLIELAIRSTGRDFMITRVADGEAALRVMAQCDAGNLDAPDVVLLDLNIPKLDGLEVLEALRRMPRWRSIPVGVLSSSAALSDKNSANSLGATKYIRKPVALDEFLSTVESAVLEMLDLPRSAEALGAE